MSSKNKKIYFILISIVIFFIILVLIAFSLIPPYDPDGFFITIGNSQIEWMFAILMFPLMIMITGLFSIYIVSPLFSKIIFKSIAKKKKLGLAPTERLNGFPLFLRLFGRSTLLALFAFNICYNLGAQEAIVQFIRSVSPNSPYSIPDVETLLQLLWIVSIPCTLVVVPIWLMIDAGVISTKKSKGVDFEFANLGSSGLYVIIKGYVGIVFIFNLMVILTSRFAAPLLGSNDVAVELTGFIGLFSPLVAICFAFPLVIFIDYQKDRIKERMENVLTKLSLNKDITCIIEVRDRK